MDHTKPLEGSGGLEMELKGKLFKFSSPFPTLIDLIDAYLTLFELIDPYLAQIEIRVNKPK